MSTPVAETKPAEEQVPKEEVKEETSSEEVQMKEADKEATAEPTKAAETSTAADATAMEVDSSQTETKPEAAASGEEVKVKSEAKANGASADAKAKNDKLRLNGAARKRFRWLLDQGYSREEAAQLAKEPLKTKELRDRFNADTNVDDSKIEEELKNLGGAAKKRFKWLLKNGYTEKEALKMAREPMNAIASKRNLSTSDGPPSKVSRPTPDAAGGIVMAVAAQDYPTTNLTHKQTNEVKAAILKEVVQQKDSELKPRFESCVHVKGYLRVHCSDHETRQWLHRVVTKLTVPEGIKLKAASEKNLVKGDIFTGYFTDSRGDTNEAILEFVESQNDGIVTSKWKILTRKEVPNKQTVELMFSVDPPSAKSIHNLGYELNYKFNKVKVRKQIKPADKAAPVVANSNLRTARSMAPPQRERRSLNQPRTNSSGSFVPIWDSNVPQRRSGNNQFDSQRNSFSSGSGVNWSNALNSFGLGGTGGSDSYGMSSSYGGNNSYGGSNSGGGSGGRSNSFMGSNSRSNSFGGGSNYRSNSYGGSNSRSNSNSNSFGMGGGGGGGGRGGNQSSNRPFNLVDSLYDQLKLIGSGGGNNNNNSNGYGTSSRRSGGGGGNSGAGSNQRGRNTSSNSSFSGRTSSGYGNRSFFTTTRSGFF